MSGHRGAGSLLFNVRKCMNGGVCSYLFSSFTAGRRWIFSVLGIVLLLGLGVISFANTGGLVRPITGLATLGGLFGSITGLAAYRSVRSEVDTIEDVVATVVQVFVSEFTRTVNVIGYGTFIGYSYPRAMWNLGARVMGANGYPFGRIVWPLNALPAAVLATVLLLVVTLGVIRLRQGTFPPLEGRRLLAFVAGYTVYGLWIFVATGFAGHVWFPLVGIPS